MHPSTGLNAVGDRVDDPDIMDGDRVVEAREGRMVDELVGRCRSRARHCQRLQARFVTVAERSCPGRAEVLEPAGHLTLIREHITGPATMLRRSCPVRLTTVSSLPTHLAPV